MKRRSRSRTKQSPALGVLLGIVVIILVLKSKSIFNFFERQEKIETLHLNEETDIPEKLLHDAVGPEFIMEPRFDLDAINAACNTDIPKEVFTNCRNKKYTMEDMVTGELQKGISPRVHILGERHSGTNLASWLARTNFELVFNKTLVPTRFPVPFPQHDYGINRHKHNMQVDGPYEGGLSIISIRNPYDYTKSMTKKCYSCGHQEKNRDDVDVFVGTPWYGGNHADDYHFDNLMAMRKTKYCNYLEKAAKLTDCIMFVRSEDNMLSTQQDHFVWRMSILTGWPLKQTYPSVQLGYSGHSKKTHQGQFSVGNLVDDLLYFKSDKITEKEGKVVNAVNTYMEKAFEDAMGYTPKQLPSEMTLSLEETRHDKNTNRTKPGNQASDKVEAKDEETNIVVEQESDRSEDSKDPAQHAKSESTNPRAELGPGGRSQKKMVETDVV